MTGIDVIAGEIGQSWRTLLRRPGYLALAVLTLALGVAATTAVFALIDKALLRPLPFPQSERLVMLGTGFVEGRRLAAPGYRTALQGLDGIASMGLVAGFTRNSNLATGEDADVVASLQADHGFLDTLGLPMAAGRNFNVDEDRPNGPRAAILSHGFWQRRFGGDPTVVGTSLAIEGRAVPIVGVAPAALQWSTGFDLILPMQAPTTSTDLSTNEVLVARLAPEASLEAVGSVAAARLRAAYVAEPGAGAEQLRWMEHTPIGGLPLAALFSAQARTLWMFFAAAGCVLLIAAINLGNLMLLRALSRGHDAAVRAALGASAPRLALPALGEGLLVGALGAACGLALGWAGLRVFGGLVPADWLRGETAGLTAGGVAFAVAVALSVAAAGALLGLWRGRGGPLVRELVAGGRGGWSRGAGRMGRALVVAQVATATLLLIGAGLFAHSLHRLLSVPMGFESRDVSTFTLSPVAARYPDLASSLEQTVRLVDGLARLPGVESVAVANVPPTSEQFNMAFELSGQRTISAQYRMLAGDYAGTLGLPVLAGRMLEHGDATGREPVAVVNAAFARAYLDGEATGRTLRLAYDDAPPMRVVGVVGDTRQFGPAERAPAIVYVPFAQVPDNVWALTRQFMPLTYLVRGRPGGGATEQAIRGRVAEAAPGQPIAGLRTLQALVAGTTSAQRLNLLLVGLFAGLALLLASVGLYAVMAVAVESRRHEFGVRAALGAPPQRLLRQVLREGVLQVGLGLAIGLALAMAMSRLLQRWLFEVEVADPLAIGGVLLVLSLAGLAASLVPALRASRVPPMQALRMD